MAASGRMSKVHSAFGEGYQGGGLYSPVTPRVNPSQYTWGIGEAEPPREMERISPQHKRSPGIAQGRWSHGPATLGGLGEAGEQGTPLRNSFQREDIGPGKGQVKDPNLHEQYFGIADEGEDDVPVIAGPSSRPQGVAYQPPHVVENDRSHWV